MDVSSMNKSTTGFDKNDKNSTNENWKWFEIKQNFSQKPENHKDGLLPHFGGDIWILIYIVTKSTCS